MQATIIPSDQLVIVDGVAVMGIDMTGVDPDINAVQFDGETGHIEFTDGALNMMISSVAGFQWLFNLHAEHLVHRDDPFWGLDDVAALALAKALKLRELSAAMETAAALPVTVGEHTYFGGQASALALKGQYDLIKDYVAAYAPDEAPVTTVTFHDINGYEVILPLESDSVVDGVDVVAQVSMAYNMVAFNYAAKVGSVERAISMAELEIITF